MVKQLNCLDFWPIKLPNSWIIVHRNAPQGDVLAIEQKLKHVVSFVLIFVFLDGDP